MSILPAMGLWFLSIPFQSLTLQSSLWSQLETAFFNVFWSFLLWPLFMMCSRLVDYQDNERSLFLRIKDMVGNQREETYPAIDFGGCLVLLGCF